ncbi:MAG: hypothetical protein ACFFCE_06800 [Promethearchaeota archaeon]
MSTGTIYHHLESLSELIQQKKDKKYYLKELGQYAYNSLKDNIELIKTPNSSHQKLKSPILRKFMKLTSKRFICFGNDDKLITIILSLGILIIGSILCGLNNFYSFSLFFIDFEQLNIDTTLRILITLSFFLNSIFFFIIIEGIARILFKKKENSMRFLISFPFIQFPMIIYLIAHLGFKFFDLLSISIFNLLDKILLIIFQVWSLWLLSYSLCMNKELKIETSLIFSLLLHYGSFTIILFLLV